MKINQSTRFITYILMVAVLISILFNDLTHLKFNGYIFTITSIMAFVTIGVFLQFSGDGKSSQIQLFMLGLYIIFVTGYTIYQWSRLYDEGSSECGFLLPHSDNFNKEQYHLYRIIYLVTIIAIVSLLQFKVDSEGFKLPGGISPHNFLFMSPLILPLLTELIDWLMNLFYSEEKSSNPETLLANFFLGNSEWPEEWGNLRIVMPIIFYLILIFVMIDSSYGFSFSSLFPTKGNTSIYLCLFIVVFFSFIMRTIFIQDCSLEDSNKLSEIEGSDFTNRVECVFEKYGGIQTMACISLVILLIYHVKNPVYKILFFMIICLGSWALSTTYMLIPEEEL